MSFRKRFLKQTEKGNINGALKFLTDNMQNGILPLNDETLRLIHQKLPAPKEADVDILLQERNKGYIQSSMMPLTKRL